jgi:2,4-dienoyl-CoA reductase-like NADH-dependent reductase (Old Yellow Enzyme family)
MAADLFTPLSLRGTEVPNRLTVSPMCQYSVEDRDGVATEWHHVHLGSRAVGGAGLVMTEAAAVEPRGRISPEDLGIWGEDHAAALERTAAFVRAQGSLPGIQLAHAGRKASKTRPWEGNEPLAPDEGGWTAVGPTDEPWPYDGDPPATEALTREGIADVVDAFRAAARRAADAGFAVAEVHAAHGYLLHQFLSPVTNDREDAYGGGFEGRTRIVREVTAAVREAWPDDRPVFVRLSATDWLPDRESWTVDDTTRLADRLHGAGADLIDVSSGGIAPGSSPDRVGPNYQLPLAEAVREGAESGVAVGTVGGITTAQQADAVVANDRADLAIVGRGFLRDPYFGLHAADELGERERNEPPVQYRRVF